MSITVGITGSTGIAYAVRFLEQLSKANVDSHLIMSDWAKKCLSLETNHSFESVKSLATHYSDDSNMASSVSSGTHKSDGMIVIPCSMKTLSAISTGYDNTLIARAAGVTIKESRKLVLVTRETPLSAIHLENMLKLSRLGIVILPPVPGFYTKPNTIDDIINHTVGKCLDQFNIDHDLYRRWGS